MCNILFSFDNIVSVPVEYLYTTDACRQFLKFQGSLMTTFSPEHLRLLFALLGMLPTSLPTDGLLFVFTINDSHSTLHHIIEYGRLMGFTHTSKHLPQACGIYRYVIWYRICQHKLHVSSVKIVHVNGRLLLIK